MLTAQHTFLDHCWVCDTRFSSNLIEHRHHIIPKAYGGVDGPQVSLCDSHHSALHFIALKLYNKKPFNHLLTHVASQDKKLLWLATMVYHARLATEKDPNKRQVLVLSPTRETLDKLKQLKRVYGNLSKENLVALAIDSLFNKHFK